MKILFITNERQKEKKIKRALAKEFLIEVTESVEEGLYFAESSSYDAIMLGLEDIEKSCRELRLQGVQIPIIVITTQYSTLEKVAALNAGADDYIPVDVDKLELQAHLHAITRRSHTAPISHVMNVDDLSLDTVHKTVKRKNQIIHLRRKEFEMLEYFMRNKGKVITRQMLLDNLWISTFETYTNTIDVHVKYLRDRVDRPFDKKLIKTVYGFGYKLEA